MTTEPNPPSAVYEPLPLELLEFDHDNPRFARGPVPEEEGGPLGYLALHSNLIDLMQSIAAQGYFPGEPIMVVRVETEGGEEEVETEGGEEEVEAGADQHAGHPDQRQMYRVIEGNRRLAACWLLSHPEQAPEKIRSTARELSESARHKPSVIPALIFDKEADILRYLGYRHISGVQEWSPLAKARYVKRLFGEMAPTSPENERLAWVGERIGVSRAYVARLMTSLELYERSIRSGFFGLDVRPEELSFSLLTVAINRRSVTNFLNLESSKDFHAEGLNERALTQLLSWIFVKRGDPPRTVLGDSRNMRFLAEILADQSGRAVEVLNRTANLDEAYTVATQGHDVVVPLAKEALVALEEIETFMLAEDRVFSFEELAEFAKIESVLARLKTVRTTVSAEDGT